MTRENIKEVTSQFLVEEFEVDANLITDDAPLKETLNLDSLDFVDLVVFMESHFGFKVNPEDFINLKTFAEFYDYIESRLAAA